MRILIVFFILIFTAAFASKNVDFIDQIRSLDQDQGIYRVTFWGNNKVFKFAEGDRVIPCLKTAYKAQKEVRLILNKEEKIQKCSLFGGKISAR